MIKIKNKIPNEIIVACSGGADSIAVADFLSRSRKVSIAYFNHNTKFSNDAEEFVAQFAKERNLNFIQAKLASEKPKENSLEEFWRIERYNFLHSLNNLVITAHSLDDQIETWIFSSLHGQSKLIPFQNKNVIRSFMLNSKSDFIEWNNRKNVKWLEDPSNNNTQFMRNKIRHDLMPLIKQINPGIKKTILKKCINL